MYLKQKREGVKDRSRGPTKRAWCELASDENSEKYPLGRRLLLHGLGVEELTAVAVAGLPPLLRPDEPRQEPPDLLLLAALLLHLPLPLRRRLPAGRLFLPPRFVLHRGRHQRLRESVDVDEG
uniref:Uncharacterized protein n=1 Tax=Arundo donax TaxID=35708 RepID=A0A0A9HM06_ARUDO